MNYKSKQISISFLIFLILLQPICSSVGSYKTIDAYCNLKKYPDGLLVSTDDPFYSIISLPLACWYNQTAQFLKPFVLIEKNSLSSKQIAFLSATHSENNLLSIGCKPKDYTTLSFMGSPVSISQKITKNYFQSSDTALILPYNSTPQAYKISMLASPLASYLHIPILLYDTEQQNHADIIDTLQTMNISTIYLSKSIEQSNYQSEFDIITLHNVTHIQQLLLDTIKKKFNSLNYITITNPSDVISEVITKKHTFSTTHNLDHTALFLFGKKFLLSGADTKSATIQIPEGINKVIITVSMKNKTSMFPSSDVPVFLSATLADPNGKTVAYAHSPGYGKNQTYLETVVTNLSGSYIVNVSLFHGYRGGYFSLRGLSNVNTEIVIETEIHTQSSSHYPLISELSLNAPYLTSAHGGIIIADEHFSLTDETYNKIASQHATGPWYDERLHGYNNEKVDYIITRLKENLSIVKQFGLYKGYMNQSGWLALLGDTNMIPMYYYPSNQTHLVEKGLPSDNPYSLHHQLSPGRIMSYSTCDASLLIGRTFFYQDICGPAHEDDSWHHTFNFVFGEGFGETGGFFHQIPYANTIESYGFKTEVFGNFRNSRKAAERFHVYDNTNYVEYLGHGDWFWYTPSIYGFNSVGQSIGSMHVRDWKITRPNVVLTSACLMGRVDGVPPKMSIALSFLHAGSNAFIGATRETGQEAGLTVLEDHLILDDYSLGEALRGEKRVDTVNPTYAARCLFGDPAFNPYDPLHGFSNQGTPYPIHNNMK